MLLAIDVGNTQTVIGLFDTTVDLDAVVRDRCDAGLVDTWRISTVAERTADEQALTVQEFLGFHGFSFDTEISGIVISSVVPRCTSAFREMARRYFGFEPVVVEPGVKTGLPVLTENPREVGADRIANAVAAVDVYGGPALAIDFGTATTYDAISENGELLGCAIAPGIDISLDALYQRADALRRVDFTEPRGVIGRSTVESLQSGAVYGFAGQVDGIAERILNELGGAKVVATGGLASVIAPYTRSITTVEPWLTLHGLRLIHGKNQ